LAVVRRLADERLRRDCPAGDDFSAWGETVNKYFSEFAPCAGQTTPEISIAVSPLNSADIAATLGKDRRWVRRALSYLREDAMSRCFFRNQPTQRISADWN
jgi:hypothetical protein